MNHTLHVYRTKSRGAKNPREWRWRITHKNGNKIANGGEGYQRFEKLAAAFRALFIGAPILVQLNRIEAEHLALLPAKKAK